MTGGYDRDNQWGVRFGLGQKAGSRRGQTTPQMGHRKPGGNHGKIPRWRLNCNFVTKKSKMAANVNFSESLRRPLQRAKSDCLGQTSSGNGIKKVSDFFSELEVAVEVLEENLAADRPLLMCKGYCPLEEWWQGL